MRINTSDKYAWRTDLYNRAADRLGENTRTGGIDASCEFACEMMDNLEEAIEHEDMTPELAEVLSTSQVTVRYDIDADVSVDD